MSAFDSKGNPKGYNSKLTNNYQKDQDSQVCMLESGKAVIAWYDSETHNVVYSKYADGTLSVPALVNSPDNSTTEKDGKDGVSNPHTKLNGTSYQPAIACIPGSDYAIVTYSDDADGNGYFEIYGVGLEIK